MLTLPNGTPLDLDSLTMAMEDADLAHRYFLNLLTGDVVFFSDYPGLSGEDTQLLEHIEESGDYVAVERIPSHEAYQWMVDFVTQVVAPVDERTADMLSIALDGRGAFRRFTQTLQRVDTQWRQAWDQWREERLMAAVGEWIEDLC
jgi:hypothetical protein